MRYRFLFNFLKLTAATKGIRKINLFLNFAIFLSIFAITSTLISIYYESKITSLERKITKNEITLDILSVSTLAIPGKVLSLENIADDIKKNNEKCDLQVQKILWKKGKVRDVYELSDENNLILSEASFEIMTDLEDYPVAKLYPEPDFPPLLF